MKKKAKILLSLGFLLTTIYFLLRLISDPIDSCLDLGGCWDYADEVCRRTEANAQDLCDRANPHRSQSQ